MATNLIKSKLSASLTDEAIDMLDELAERNGLERAPFLEVLIRHAWGAKWHIATTATAVGKPAIKTMLYLRASCNEPDSDIIFLQKIDEMPFKPALRDEVRIEFSPEDQYVLHIDEMHFETTNSLLYIELTPLDLSEKEELANAVQDLLKVGWVFRPEISYT